MNLTPTEYINLNRETLPPQTLAYLLDLEQANLTVENLSDDLEQANLTIEELIEEIDTLKSTIEESEVYVKHLRDKLDNLKGAQP